MNIKAHDIRNEFPIFKKRIHGHRLAYLDSAATTQKPQCVIDAITHYYSEMNSNIHRGVHYLSEQATIAFEEARETVQQFINAKETKECIFTRGTTEAINLVAQCFGERYVQPGDEILISALEHHSNIVPWQMLCQRKGAFLKVIPMLPNGELDLNSIDGLLNAKTKLVALTHVSNALGTLIPIKTIIDKAHKNGSKVLIDGAQSVKHMQIDVQALDCDFFVFSGHKIYGPTGIGVLYGKASLLRSLPPFQGGGDMILKVTHSETIYQDIPFKFEAGTPPIAEVLGLKKALEFLQNIGFDKLAAHDRALLQTAMEALSQFPEITAVGPELNKKSGVISFIMEDVHPHDIGTILDQHGVAVRSGHHCAMPVMDFLKLPATVRLSFGIYNNEEDIVQLIDALKEVKRIFRVPLKGTLDEAMKAPLKMPELDIRQNHKESVG